MLARSQGAGVSRRCVVVQPVRRKGRRSAPRPLVPSVWGAAMLVMPPQLQSTLNTDAGAEDTVLI